MNIKFLYMVIIICFIGGCLMMKGAHQELKPKFGEAGPSWSHGYHPELAENDIQAISQFHAFWLRWESPVAFGHVPWLDVYPAAVYVPDRNYLGVLLGVQLALHEIYPYFFKKNIEKNLREAPQGNVEGLLLLGTSYLHGYGVEKNLERAEYWFGQAANQGSSLAFLQLAKIYAYEKDGRDIVRIGTLYTRALEFNKNIRGWRDSKDLVLRRIAILASIAITLKVPFEALDKSTMLLHQVCSIELTKDDFDILINEEIINSQDLFGNTPLHMAVQTHHTGWVTSLLEHGADSSFKNEAGQTPLHVAVQVDDAECVRVLLHGDTNLNLQDAQGRTPLLHATQLNRARIVDLLMRAGADPNIKDNEGHDASYWLEKNMH